MEFGDDPYDYVTDDEDLDDDDDPDVDDDPLSRMTRSPTKRKREIKESDTKSEKI